MTSFTCQNFDVTYFGVEESRSSALKHCQDALHALINRAKKNGRKMRTCQARIYSDSMEIHFPPDSKQESMRIPTHFMQLAGVDSYYRKVCFLSVAGKHRTSSDDKVGVFGFLCAREETAEEMVNAISNAFQTDYTRWQAKMNLNGRAQSVQLESNYVQPHNRRPQSFKEESNHYQASPSSPSTSAIVQADGSYLNQKERRISRSINRKNSQHEHRAATVNSDDLRHPAIEADDQASAVQEIVQENQLPANVINELQQKLKMRGLDKIDETEKQEAFTWRLKTRKNPQLLKY